MELSFLLIHVKKEGNKMFIVKLMNEFVHGVLWVCDEDGISTNYDLIDKDVECFLAKDKAIKYLPIHPLCIWKKT